MPPKKALGSKKKKVPRAKKTAYAKKTAELKKDKKDTLADMRTLFNPPNQAKRVTVNLQDLVHEHERKLHFLARRLVNGELEHERKLDFLAHRLVNGEKVLAKLCEHMNSHVKPRLEGIRFAGHK